MAVRVCGAAQEQGGGGGGKRSRADLKHRSSAIFSTSQIHQFVRCIKSSLKDEFMCCLSFISQISGGGEGGYDENWLNVNDALHMYT